MTPPAAIELHELTKRFGDLVALDRLSLTVPAGEIFGLLGPNGSGKTTTINLVSGLSRPTSGSAHVLGHDVVADPRSVRRQLGVIPQETALYEDLSAEANLRFHADLFDVPKRELATRLDRLFGLVGLTDRRRDRVSTYSGGMKRRLALARALLHDPELLYLDEPTLGVDVQSRRAIWDYCLDLKKRGKTLLVTTNYLEEANELCDRIAILDQGRVIALDTPSALKRTYGDTVLELEMRTAPSEGLIERVRRVEGVGAIERDERVLTARISGRPEAMGDVVTLVARESPIVRIAQRQPGLDDVFLQLTGRGLRD